MNPGGIAAGGFAEWLGETLSARRNGEEVAVACGECRGCCTSGYFIHIAPDETEALAAIPKALLFPAPGLPKGHRVMGYDVRGHCPMFKANACSIYAARPRTCRQYDCRVFAATGLTEGEARPAIAAQAARWRFEVPGEADAALLQAARSAGRFLADHAERFPAGFLPPNPAQRAMLALRVHGLFLGDGGIEPDADARAAAIVAALAA